MENWLSLGAVSVSMSVTYSCRNISVPQYPTAHSTQYLTTSSYSMMGQVLSELVGQNLSHPTVLYYQFIQQDGTSFVRQVRTKLVPSYCTYIYILLCVYCVPYTVYRTVKRKCVTYGTTVLCLPYSNTVYGTVLYCNIVWYPKQKTSINLVKIFF